MKVVTIFLRVPKEELRKRLEERIDQADQKEIELRLSRFDYEESKMDNYDYVIKEGKRNKVSYIDCLINEVQGSINSAFVDGDITEEQCDYLFKKYVYGGIVW